MEPTVLSLPEAGTSFGEVTCPRSQSVGCRPWSCTGGPGSAPLPTPCRPGFLLLARRGQGGCRLCVPFGVKDGMGVEGRKLYLNNK